MCFNLAYMQKRQQKFAERYKEILPPDWSIKTVPEELPTYYFVSGFSHPQLAIVKHDGIFLFEWGLIPLWIKDIESANNIRSKTLNAVGETVFEKPSFRKIIATQRCLLGVTGFYEWRDINNVKYPYFIKTLSSDIFSLGCIYESWVDKSTGEIRNTFSILTTPANPLMESIHNIKKRMPLIISTEDEKKWIEPTLTKAQINELIKPYNDSDMTAYTVSQTVNSARNNRNVPESIVEVDYPELRQF
jgi:putative SOS response-associated peptidase YedK